MRFVGCAHLSFNYSHRVGMKTYDALYAKGRTGKDYMKNSNSCDI
jgi:hypothetical protein